MNERPVIPDAQAAALDIKRYFGPQIEKQVEKPTTAIDNASDASGKHANALVRATWVLAGATIALVISTVALAVVSAAGLTL